MTARPMDGVPDDGRLRPSGVEAEHDFSDHVILAGYGRRARAAVPSLRQAGIPFVITTLNPGGARQAIAEGLPVIQGDHTKANLLERAGIADAKIVVIADDELETTYRVASVARALHPGVEILACVETGEDIATIADAGASRVISAESAAGMKLGPAVLHLSKLASSFEGVDRTRVVRLEQIGDGCEHTGGVGAVLPSAGGCESCLRMGDSWVHLRICMTCGHVGCCDSSPNKHASRHYAETGHPIIVSAEPDEAWAWCFVDELQMRTRAPVEARLGEALPVADE